MQHHEAPQHAAGDGQRSMLRPMTRRAHVRVPGTTAAALERVAWNSRGGDGPPAAAVSVLPGGVLPVAVRPFVTGADLDVLLGDEESGCAPGRHRRPHPLWGLLRHLPGVRSASAASPEGVADTADTADTPDTAHDAEPHAPLDDEDEDDEDDEDDETSLVPMPRTEPTEPVYLRRRRRSPAPAVRAALQAAQARIEAAPDALSIARITCEEAARLVRGDVTALLLRAVEGPRVLWLHPGGPDGPGLWGPATLAALLKVGHPVRRVVEGDPLADGEATALLAVPVPAGGSLAGTLLARRHEARTFSANEQDVLGRLARMAGAALLAASRPAPRGRQDVDAVTGLSLARRFTSDVEAAARTSQRQGTPVSVLAVHVEGLARVRTELGERPADEVLQALAAAVTRVLRVGDLAYRIGPDEIALLLPATDPVALGSLRERLDAVTEEAVAGLELPGGRRPLGLRTAPVPLTGAPAGRSVVDAATRALELDRQKVRWSPV